MMTDLTTPISRKGFTNEYRIDVCRIGQGQACCRYLTFGVQTPDSPPDWDCEKHTDLAALLDARVAEGSMTAQGDNCGGILL